MEDKNICKNCIHGNDEGQCVSHEHGLVKCEDNEMFDPVTDSQGRIRWGSETGGMTDTWKMDTPGKTDDVLEQLRHGDIYVPENRTFDVPGGILYDIMRETLMGWCIGIVRVVTEAMAKLKSWVFWWRG